MRITRLTSFLIAGSFLLAACGGDDDGSGGECSGTILPGDLVITEVMSNPAGMDTGQEWFEIYNASSAAIDLGGLTLVYHKTDGSEEHAHVMDELVIEAGDYIVLGGMTTDLKPAYVDYGFGNDLGSFLNGGAVLALKCGDSVIDESTYPDAESDDGVAFGIDGNVAPNSVANDDIANFCPATVEFQSGMFGSPGESNEPCNLVVPGMCNQGGTPRPTVPPAAGDIVISEFLADADDGANGSDTGREWFEIYVAREVDLNGLVAGIEVGKPKVSIDAPECVTAPAQTYFLFAASDDMLLNGGMDNVDKTFNFTLKNMTTSTGDGYLYVGIGETVLDEISYTDTTEGQSTALDPAMLDAAANDDPANWVLCEAPYGDETNRGTPRMSNATCNLNGMCRDGDSFRAINPPGPGEIMITEAMPNPEGPEPDYEWFEVTALADFDLNGVQFGKAGVLTETVGAVDCIAVTDGAVLVFADTLPPGDNGGLPQADFQESVGLNNSTGSDLSVGVRDEILHTFTFGTTSSEGRSKQLDPDGVTVCYTPETTPYGPGPDCTGDPGDGNCGTPGQPNPQCP
jgi:hypothetical protein